MNSINFLLFFHSHFLFTFSKKIFFSKLNRIVLSILFQNTLCQSLTWKNIAAHTFSLGTMITSVNINEKIKCHIFKQYFFSSEENISLSHYLFVIVSFPGKKVFAYFSRFSEESSKYLVHYKTV